MKLASTLVITDNELHVCW